jgi:hypothetical protein
METTKQLKKGVLDLAVESAFKELFSLHKLEGLPESIYLTGTEDVTMLTKAMTELSCKLRRHEVKWYIQEIPGAKPINFGRHYGRALAEKWCEEKDSELYDRPYAVVRGLNGSVREGFALKLKELSGKNVYPEMMYPNSPGFLAIDLEEFSNYLRAS